MGGNMKRVTCTDGKTTYVLASETNERLSDSGQLPSSSLSTRTPKVASVMEFEKPGYTADVVMIRAGEDINSQILSYFQNGEKYPAHLRGHACRGMILSAVGTIFRPSIAVAGNAIPPFSNEGTFPLITLRGTFAIDTERRAGINGSVIVSFIDSKGTIYGGSVIGPLIAATPIQVIVGIYIDAEVKEGSYTV